MLLVAVARYEGKTIWLTQKLMAELFVVDIRTVREHTKNIFISGELSEESVIRKFRSTVADGKKYLTQFYSLDAIISVGYRVNSVRATEFRQLQRISSLIYCVKQIADGLDSLLASNIGGSYSEKPNNCRFDQFPIRKHVFDMLADCRFCLIKQLCQLLLAQL
ncbi:RhuM family protein [Glaciimonas sp. GG7]